MNHIERKKDDHFIPSVSMIIAAYNEDKVIYDKIKNCIELDYPKNKIEIVIGSDHSSDKTDKIIKQQKRKHDNIKLFIFPKREGKSKVLNKIVPKATGKILVFSDANTMYNPESIKKLIQHFADSKIGGVCGKLVLVNPNDNIGGKGESLYWKYENHIKFLEGKIKTVFGATGGIYAIRKKLFVKLPYHKTNISDDFLIPIKVVELGYDVVYENEAIAKEYTSFSIKDEFLRKVRIGSANLYSIGKIRKLLNPFKGYVAFGVWSHKIIRWTVPIFLILIFISNIFIANTFIYNIIMIIQFIFYIFALIGWLLSEKNIKFNIFSYPLYFVVINLGLLVGFIKYVAGTISPMWSRLER